MSRRSIGRYLISFGMVSVPTLLYTATDPKDVRFKQITPAGNLVSQKLTDKVTGDVVEHATLRKGYEYMADTVVIIEPDQIEAMAAEQNKKIEIGEFVNLSDIDPLYFDKSYYLAPDKGGEKAYSLLLATLKKSKRAGIAKFQMRSKEQTVVIRARGEALLVSTLFYADELVDVEEIPSLQLESVNKAELAVALQLVEAYSAEFDPVKYEDTFRNKLLTLIEKEFKRQFGKGKKPVVVPSTSNVMDQLRASVAQAKQRKTA